MSRARGGSARGRCTRASTPDPSSGRSSPPIHQTSTYAQPAPGEYVADYDYARSANPTRTALERALGELEGGRAVTFASGMAAEHGLLTVVAEGRRARRAARRPLRRHVPARGQGADALGAGATTSSTRPTSTRSPARSGPRRALVWVESPTNPTLDVIDVGASSVARARGAPLVAVDNTFATPANQQPLALGADFAVHSTTKYLGGHSDTVGGAVIVGERGLGGAAALRAERGRGGPGPFDCFLVHRGLRTLHLRMAAHAASAEVVRGLRADPRTSDVRWPGFSGMVSFRHPDARALVAPDASSSRWPSRSAAWSR